jgi:hypothetical protein
MIIQHLQDEGYMGSVMTLQDETNVRQTEQITKINHMKKMKKSILGIYIRITPVLFCFLYIKIVLFLFIILLFAEGDWAEVEKLCTKQTFKTQQSFLYAVYKQAYLELLERQEYQKVWKKWEESGEEEGAKKRASPKNQSLLIIGVYVFDQETKAPGIATNEYRRIPRFVLLADLQICARRA